MAPGRSILALVEVAVITAGYFFITWILGPRIQEPWAGTTALLLIAIGITWFAWLSPAYVHGDTLAERGLGGPGSAFVRTDNLGRSAREFGVLCAVTCLILLAASCRTNPHAAQRLTIESFAVKLGYYFFFALTQAGFFFGFVSVRLGKLLGGAGGAAAAPRARAAVVGSVAVLFTLCHLPNLPLMAIAFPTALAFGWLYVGNPNLVVLAAAHAFLGTVLHKVVALHMRVGPFYRDSESYLIAHLLPFLEVWKDIIYRP